MDTLKNIMQKNRVAKANQHIPPIAILLFGIFLVIAIFGATKVNHSWVNAWITG